MVYYNQDVDINNRGVNTNKIYEPKEHFAFNLDYLKEEEKKNISLKRLLDELRCYTLFQYYINKVYRIEVENIIKNVDFSNLPRKYWFRYKIPFLLIKVWWIYKRTGSIFKQYFIRKMNYTLNLLKNISIVTH